LLNYNGLGVFFVRPFPVSPLQNQWFGVWPAGGKNLMVWKSWQKKLSSQRKVLSV